jgi:hypothetical protein
MAIEYKKSLATFTDFVGVEEAEALLEWLLKNPKGKLNLADCTHLHASSLQVLMAVKPVISAEPKDENLQLWLKAALRN